MPRFSGYKGADFKEAASWALGAAIIAIAPTMALHVSKLFTWAAAEAILSVGAIAFVTAMAGYLQGLQKEMASKRNGWKPGMPERRRKHAAGLIP